MRQILFFSLFIILFLTPCSAQHITTCPKIKVSASQSKYPAGEPILFSVSTIGGANQKLEYVWETSSGSIIEGEQTPSVTINSAGLADIVVKATVEIKGLPKNCENRFSAEVFVDAPPRAIHPEDISGPLSNNLIKAYTDTLYSRLTEEPKKIAVVIIYGTDREFSIRQAQFIKAIKSGKYDISRIKFVRGSRDPGIRMRVFTVSAEAVSKPD